MVRIGGVHSVDGDIRDRGGGQARQGEGHTATEVSFQNILFPPSNVTIEIAAVRGIIFDTSNENSEVNFGKEDSQSNVLVEVQ